ncbi:MAG: CPBP family intramembrane metalloprotease [Candidatus Omnitrophica bacterium]|nr:CPBP family intramembrane metalloprotease [Candidatus Omnitrophota bacterium]
MVRYVAVFIIALSLLSFFNNIQSIINGYPTSVSLLSFLFIYLIKVLINLTIFCAIIILPGLAGEVLRSEQFPQKQFSSFVHYLRASFYSRNVARAIIFGYCVFFVMLGAQSLIFYLGQKYFGVWKEWFNLTQFSSANLPFFSAFVLAATAGINEEIIFRLFGITWAKKYLKNVFLAVLFAALIWGFGHSQYAIFPIWFRGIEVSILGILLGFVFLKYGIIPVIVAHYLFNAFWGVSAYILGKSNYSAFYGSLFILSIPILFALFAFFANKGDKERELKSILNEGQKFNLSILIAFVSAKKLQGNSAEMITHELIAHHWDIELIKLAIKEVFK